VAHGGAGGSKAGSIDREAFRAPRPPSTDGQETIEMPGVESDSRVAHRAQEVGDLAKAVHVRARHDGRDRQLATAPGEGGDAIEHQRVMARAVPP
jgi:hypothetical protein